MVNIIETNLSFGSMTTRSRTSRIIVHHAEASSCTAEQIHSWHKGNGWAGAGYHFFVRKDGSVYRLRPENKVGSHAAGSNSDSLGICFEGNFNNETMGSAQIQAGKELVGWLKGKYGISKVQRHKDVYDTDCPGANFPFGEIAGAAAGGSATSSGGGSSSKNYLAKGDSGSAVKELQQKLIAAGYSCGSCGADGIFGSGTDSAVRAFQRDHGLTVDGLAGNATMSALNGSKASSSTSSSFPLPSGHWYGKPNSDDRNHSGYYNSADRPAIEKIQAKVGSSVDGYFGENTSAKVKSWQSGHSLKADGLVGINTWSKMF